METALSQSNFAAGELSPKMRDRHELPVYNQGAERVVNFISETSGPLRFRSGFQFVFGTRRYQPAWLWPFQFNDSDAYELEFTTGYIRFYRNGGIITAASQNISGASKANPCVLTVTGHGLSNGAEVIVNGAVGMTQLNNRSFVIANVTTNTFSLTDNFGNAISSTTFGTYVSGGTISPVYEVISPYNVADVPALKIGQNADVLYIDHHNYEPMKLTRFGDNSWTMTTYTRYGDMCMKNLNISAVTLANPCQITSTAHGLITGQKIYVSGLSNAMITGGGPPFDGSQLITITKVDADNFTLNSIDSTSYTAYVSGGAIQVPYLISAITQANPAQVTVTNHGLLTGAQVILNSVGGMVQLNNATGAGYFTITKVDANNFTLNGINSTGYTSYTSGGYALDKSLLVGAVAFYQGRLYHAYSDTYPESFWGSQPLDQNGNPQYDYFNLGANVADAFKFTLSPISSKVDKIESLVPSINFLAICTFEGVSSANGGSAGAAITPSAIDVTPAVTFGCLQQITPYFLGISMVYIHRSGLIMYSFEYDIFFSAYNAMDKDLTCDNWSQSGITQMVFQVSRPTAFWFARNDGVLVGRTYMVKENVNGIHRHVIGGTNPKVLSVGIMPRANAYDQLWIVSQRTINGHTVCFVEYANDDIVIPEQDDYWTGNQAADLLTWQNAIFEAQKQYVYMDAALTYDGSVFGANANATLTPASTTGNTVVFTASNPVFTSSMVGRQLWKQAQNGVGMGRALISAYTDSTHVTCQILTSFDNINAMPAGAWYLTTNVVNGIWHLQGEMVTVLADGAPGVSQAVTNGAIPLGYDASVVHVGEGYVGLIRTMKLHPQSQAGETAAKNKNINQLGISFLNTAGVSYGTDLYHMNYVPFGDRTNLMGRPIPLFSGTKKVVVENVTGYDQHIYIQQTLPLPCMVGQIIPFVDFDTE